MWQLNILYVFFHDCTETGREILTAICDPCVLVPANATSAQMASCNGAQINTTDVCNLHQSSSLKGISPLECCESRMQGRTENCTRFAVCRTSQFWLCKKCDRNPKTEDRLLPLLSASLCSNAAPRCRKSVHTCTESDFRQIIAC